MMKRAALPGFIAVLALALGLTACVSSPSRTEPPAPIYDKGQPRASTASATRAVSSGVQTTAISGPAIRVGSGPDVSTAVPAPESAISAPAISAPSSGWVPSTLATSPVTSSAPAPVTGSAAVPVTPSATLAYAAPPAPPVKPAEPMGSAAKSLVDQADAKYSAGDLTGAASLLERAVRVEPRHPLPWNRLARVRLAQGNHSLAAELAGKSNALAGSDRALQRDNWLIVAEARRAGGDSSGARIAQQRADELR